MQTNKNCLTTRSFFSVLFPFIFCLSLGTRNEKSKGATFKDSLKKLSKLIIFNMIILSLYLSS